MIGMRKEMRVKIDGRVGKERGLEEWEEEYWERGREDGKGRIGRKDRSEEEKSIV